jgi:hypothetical protein
LVHKIKFGASPTTITLTWRASIHAAEHEVQQLVDYFKQWLPSVTRAYIEGLKREAQEKIRQEQKKLQAIREAEQPRQRVLDKLKI